MKKFNADFFESGDIECVTLYCVEVAFVLTTIENSDSRKRMSVKFSVKIESVDIGHP